jgi:hypothetical protein
MHTKHIEVIQPFSIKITHKYKYMSHYYLLPNATHTHLQECPLFSQALIKYQNS